MSHKKVCSNSAARRPIQAFQLPEYGSLLVFECRRSNSRSHRGPLKHELQLSCCAVTFNQHVSLGGGFSLRRLFPDSAIGLGWNTTCGPQAPVRSDHMLYQNPDLYDALLPVSEN